MTHICTIRVKLNDKKKPKYEVIIDSSCTYEQQSIESLSELFTVKLHSIIEDVETKVLEHQVERKYKKRPNRFFPAPK